MAQHVPDGSVSWRGLGFAAVGGFVCWVAWMGWDLYYDVNPATGAASGPYQPWQVVGSAVSLLVLVVATGLVMRPVMAVMAYVLISGAYTAGFCVSAIVTSTLCVRCGASLWPIGAVMLLLGAGTAICVVGGVVTLLRAVAGSRRPRSTTPIDS